MIILPFQRRWLHTAGFLILVGACAASHILPAQTPGTADRAAPAASPTAVPATLTPYLPMTREERLRLYLRSTVSPMAFVNSAASAGIGQWRDRPEAWGQGGEGYGKRAASSFVQHFESESMLYILSSELHEDNRYFASGLDGTGPRVRYAIASTFLARRDDGSRHFSRSRLGAVVGIAILSRAWQPQGNRRFRGAMINSATSYSVGMGFNVAREFLPRLFNRQ